jgi:hypothetical protein
MNRLSIRGGRLVGTYGPGIAYNSPWPTYKGEWGSSTPYLGTILHTMVGNLPGTINVFNTGPVQASAHLGVDQRGHIHQFGPLTGGWVAWHCAGGNYDWFGVEFADNGSPNNAYTAEQLTAAALIVDAIHAHYKIPVQVSDRVSAPGIGCHYMGGAAWGGHACPDDPYHPNHVRSLARSRIVQMVMTLRAPAPVITDEEEDMLQLDLSNGNVVLPIPAGKRTMLLTADPLAVVEYGFLPWTGRKSVNVDWLHGPHSVSIPSGTTQVTINRSGADTGTRPVTVAFV